jgi:hypothetical protein
MRTKAESDEEGAINMQLYGGPNLMHRLAVHAYKYGKGIPILLEADPLGHPDIQAITGIACRMAALPVDPNLLHLLILVRPPGQMHKTRPMKGYDSFL